MPGSQQYCTFLLDGHLFGVEVRQVQEVLRYQALTRVPLASPVVRGLINLRGQIVPALDLRRRLELPERPAEEQPLNVVVATDDGPVSFLVDQIGDVLEVGEEQFEAAPNTLRGPLRQLIGGAYKLPERLLLVLEPETLIGPAAGTT